MVEIEPHDLVRIHKFPIFENTGRENIGRALTNARTRVLKHREQLYRAGDVAQSFCLILEGAIKLIRHSPKGEDLIMHFALQGDLVGALLMNQQGQTVYPISAKSMGPSKVVTIPRETYKLYWQTQVEIQNKLNALLYRRLSNIQDDKTMSTSPLRVRLANLLLRHLDKDTVSIKPLSITLTRQEIADSLGVAVESVIRIMSEWQENGTIQKPFEKGPELINIEKLISNTEG